MKTTTDQKQHKESFHICQDLLGVTENMIPLIYLKIQTNVLKGPVTSDIKLT